jgi:signal peptidase I
MKKRFYVIGVFLLSCFLLIGIYFQFGVFPFVVVGGSMEPTLLHGQAGGADTFFYRVLGLQRFDILVIEIEDSYWIKRLIAKPNEHVFYEDGILYVNGQVVEEPFLSTAAKEATCYPYYERDSHNQLVQKIPNICQAGGLQLQEGQYFFMGDNRAESFDSRRFLIPLTNDAIVGKTFLTYGVCTQFDDYSNCLRLSYSFPAFLGVIQ